MSKSFNRHVFVLTGTAAFAFLPAYAPAYAADAGTMSSPVLEAPYADAKVAPPAGPVHELLPEASTATIKALHPSAAGSAGAAGVSGKDSASSGVTPDAYGSGGAPYTTALVKVQVQGFTTPAAYDPVSSYPFRATGKLYFSIAGAGYVCSASLIKPGVLITAAHCVYKFGTNAQSGYYSKWTWCPALSTSGNPYGCYTGLQARILTTYYNGTDVCTQSGVVCNDDMATITLAPVSNVLPGTKVGYYAYGWNGYSYHPFAPLGSATVAQISQLGYPQAINSGTEMVRNDAVGWKVVSGNLINTNIGSAETGGSSGGPWFVNLGTPASFGSGSSGGTAPSQSIVGVTSYGSTTVGYNIQGASYFGQNTQYNSTYGTYGAGNIGRLVHDTCVANPTKC